jgi:hypothetical protein
MVLVKLVTHVKREDIRLNKITKSRSAYRVQQVLSQRGERLIVLRVLQGRFVRPLIVQLVIPVEVDIIVLLLLQG